jgi:hypothetical protein
MDEWHASVLRSELAQNACSIKELAGILAAGESYPTEAPTLLCGHIATAAGVVEDYVAGAPTDQLPFANQFLCTITEHLRYVERARTPQTPWSMVEASETLLRKYVGADARFILRPQWAYNYKIAGDLIQTYREELAELDWIPEKAWERIRNEAARVYCISFPRVERLNALLHANWGHEVGHIVAHRWIEKNFASFWSPTEARLREELRANASARGRPAPKRDEKQLDMMEDQRISKILKTAMQVAQRALYELIADAVGVHILGPAALAAAAEVAARFGLDREPLETTGLYPSWRYRLKRMFGYCEADLAAVNTLCAANTEVERRLRPFLQWVDDIKATSNATITSIADARVNASYSAIERDWTRIHGESLQDLPGFPAGAYRLAQCAENVSDLVSKLSDGISPNEFGMWPNTRPAPIEDILNAGWIQKASLRTTDGARSEDIVILQRLVLKAIEASTVHATFGPRLRALDTSRDSEKPT